MQYVQEHCLETVIFVCACVCVCDLSVGDTHVVAIDDLMSRDKGKDLEVRSKSLSVK